MSGASRTARPLTKIPRSHWVGEIALDAAAYHRLETAAGVTFSGELRVQILQRLNAYHERAAEQAAAVRPAQVREPLKRIGLLARDLRVSMARSERSNPGGDAALDLIELAAFSPDRVALDFDELRKTLSALHKYSLKAAENLPKDVGREADNHLPGFLFSMHSIFALAGGEGKYTKQSLKFLEEAYRLAGGTPQSTDALLQQLKKAKNAL